MKSKKKTVLLFALLLAVATLLSGCGSSSNSDDLQNALDDLTEENEDLMDEISDLNQQISGMSSSSTEPEQYVTETKSAIGINCTLYASDADPSTAQTTMSFSDTLALSAVQSSDMGDMVFDGFKINGVMSGDSIQNMTVSENTVIEAMFRDPLKVTSVNAYIQLLNSGGEPAGDKMYEYVFENDENKQVSIYVRAEVPSGYQIDYWKIDGVPYHFSASVAYFKVLNLDKATTYEVVLQKATQMVNVSCTNATFSGGGYSGAASGTVPKGTVITVKGSVDLGNPNYWIINGVENHTYGKTFSYTVNSNTTFQYTGVN